MIKNIIVDQDNRYYCSFSGTEEFIEQQEVPTGMRLVKLEAPELINHNWVLEGDTFVLSPKKVKIHYTAQRMQEYPPISDFVDAMYWFNSGDSSKLDIYNEQCAAVKLKYPKPTE